MRHKKKRSHNPAASNAQQVRNPDRLDYSDESSAADSPLDSQEYQRAIRAHLNEFEDMASHSAANTYSNKHDPDRLDDDIHSVARLPPLPSVDHHVLSTRTKSSVKKGSKLGGAHGTADGRTRDRIWNTTTNEERERIKEFWLNLGEEERKSLVKVEKEAVLKKMKEQQKHSCSCSVCGRKRTAIEEELEVLYDAYYEELEQYANQQQFPSQSSLASSRHHIQRHPRPGKITEVLQSDDSDESFDVEDDLSDDDILTDDDLSEEDEDYSDEEYEENHAPPEFFKFGNSLTVKGGILTVADDLLKNDGKKFIEMMEQLAERRMQREEEAAMEAREYDEEQDEEYDDDEDVESEDYEDEDEEQDALTEEQRMAEGRRMFQIFAARMFEQRVLTAYREKVAQERQAQLLQELELEDSREKEREAKKLKEKEKKRDKKRQQQLKKEEERARKEAERLADEAAARAEEERKAEDLRKKKEELRLKREAEKKALETERLRKEEERKKRLAEERAREAKKQEQAAKEKKTKEDAQRREREAKEAAAKEVKAKKEALKAQRESDASRAQPEPVSAPFPPSHVHARRISPVVAKPASPAVGASPAIPRSHVPAKDLLPTSRQYQDVMSGPTGSRNIPINQQQHRSMTPGPISPQYGSHQNSFPRAALGHPPSMPIPLPPPGIGASQGSNPIGHDPFGFNSQGQQSHSQMQRDQQLPVRSNGHAASQIPGIQGPPGVFASAPGLNQSTSPQSRLGTPQGTRMPPVIPFNAFSGLGPASISSPRDDLPHDAELSFPRRTSNLLDSSIGAIGRPSPARASSILPAPIQRPTSISVPKRTGFDTTNVMGSRALLDDDDPVVDDRVGSLGQQQPSIFNSGTSWTPTQPLPPHANWKKGSAALNGSIDEPYHPPPGGDRWVSAGTIGVKPAPGQASETPSPFASKSGNWGF